MPIACGILLILTVCLGCHKSPSNIAPATQPVIASQLPTATDQQILCIVLLDLAKNPDQPRYREAIGREIVIHNLTETTNGWLSDDQINSDLRSQGHQPPSLLSSIRARNAASVSLNFLSKTSSQIIVADLSDVDLHSLFRDHPKSFSSVYPNAKAWVRAFLPGYSEDGRRAIVRIQFGPTPHGASAIYFLADHDGHWTITFYRFVHYA